MYPPRKLHFSPRTPGTCFHHCLQVAPSQPLGKDGSPNQGPHKIKKWMKTLHMKVESLT